jgi:hypothetical protein
MVFVRTGELDIELFLKFNIEAHTDLETNLCQACGLT